MTNSVLYLKNISEYAQQQNFRFGIRLSGSQTWLKKTCREWIDIVGEANSVLVGCGFGQYHQTINTKQGHQLLGQECELVIWDLSQDWDANSFSAVLGTLKGGGLLLLVGERSSHSFADQWLNKQLALLPVLSPNESTDSGIKMPMSNYSESRPECAVHQQDAIEAIKKVVTGHRKRPLVLTADRGRGKTSALGLASAELMASKAMSIVVTAPSSKAVLPLYEHLCAMIPQAIRVKDKVVWENSTLQFYSPDRLLKEMPDCDLLLVDEAAAIPIPMLQTMVEYYHRAVFSSTIYGYEGCGRGFTLKFIQWLKRHRPNYVPVHLYKPVRWQMNDPLELWHKKAFLLDDALDSQCVSESNLEFALINKADLMANEVLLRTIFSLLVNAHYQTTPNDLFQMLSDDAIEIWAASNSNTIVGCLLSVQEGGLDDELIEDICSGVRRPKGHLVPVSIANQLGIRLAAKQSSKRIMRIAVHPELQRQRIGSRLLSFFCKAQSESFISTSFGATDELIHFWQSNHFYPVKLGSKRDQASGCHSLIMVRNIQIDWDRHAHMMFNNHFRFSLNGIFSDLSPSLIRTLLSFGSKDKALQNSLDMWVPVLQNYAHGGANYESVAVAIEELIFSLSKGRIEKCSDLLLAKVLQHHDWNECCSSFSLSGRKQLEGQIRQEILSLLADLHCKM
ncbi:GNAT family N-acetyltransferase [Vibrio sp. CAIM 722]|uniref:tRNA(Met) cytidine acetyltransferase TmcA n=1 Tax=Vibrio eleionomae TaxID=2653505 RepID=A0A7X4RVR6_9VIBR|nr:GNAT family N-acetyltransferase [Vibrio eleionomae]MZI95271.1 GNAT family N-acetyltransferase [Vibrio eleionomae]